MLGQKASRYETQPPTQAWLNLSAWATLGLLGMAGWVRKDRLHDWLMGGKPVNVPPPPVGDAPAAPAALPDFLPFPLQLPTPEQIAIWRALAIDWGPPVAVWLLLGVAALGVMWLGLTLLLRLIIWRPRSAGRFTLSHAQEMATQTLLFLSALGILASGYFLPIEYLTEVIPTGVFVGFCAAIPGEKGWYTWGRLVGEWRDSMNWRRPPKHYSIPYDPPPRDDPPPAARASPQLLRLRKTLEKVEAQVNHKSTHPHQREVARAARKMLIEKIDSLEKTSRPQ